MIWIFPIAGRGRRTSALGDFKPAIKIGKRTIMEWFLLSISNQIKSSDRLYFVTTRYFSDNYDVGILVSRILKKLKLNNVFRLITVDHTPQGSACTVREALDRIPDGDEQIIVVNNDQYIDFELSLSKERKKCYMALYAEFSNKSGYATISEGYIRRVDEKNNSSNIASGGVFIFPTRKCLEEGLNDLINKHDLVRGEYYLSSTINHLVLKGYKVVPLPILTKYDLGCLEGIDSFKRSPVFQAYL